MIEELDKLIKRICNIDIKQLYVALQQDPVSFLYFHPLQKIAPIMYALSQSEDEQPTNIIANGKLVQMGVIRNLRKEFISTWEETSKQAVHNFMELINEPDGSANKLFMPTCEQDLMQLNRLDFKEEAKKFLYEFNGLIANAISALDSQRRELMKGNLKNQLSKWWLLLIKTQSELLLGRTSYDETAWSEDTYIDSPPRDIEGVRKNLQVVKELLNTESELHQLVIDVTEDIKREVYPVIDDLIMKAHVVLSHEILEKRISYQYNPNDFNIDEVKNIFDSKKESMKAELGEEIVSQYDGLIKDLKYLVEMKELENKTAEGQKKKGKLELSYAVPLSGLVMGCFFRLENILKTVLELWVPTQPITPLSPTEESLNKPANLKSPRIVTSIEKRSFGSFSPSKPRPVGNVTRSNALIGSRRASSSAIDM